MPPPLAMRLPSRNHLPSCAAGFLLACTGTVQAASGTVEIDLVFPHNDTYAPAHVFPVAFAFQHSELASYLQPRAIFRILRYGDNYKAIANGDFDMSFVNLSSSDPYIEYGESLETLNSEGTWLLEWELSTSNCSSSGDLSPTTNTTRDQMVFTTKKGAKAPDLTAATSEGMCSAALSHTFKITDTRDSGEPFENGKACPVLAEVTPAPTPCSAKINASAASSISSYLTNRACARPTVARDWCPAPKKDDGPPGLVVPSLAVGGVALLAAAIGGLGFLMG